MSNPELTPLQKAAATIASLNSRIKALEARADDPIAVVGLACRGPGAENAGELWELLANAQHAIREVPADRWDVNQYFDPRPGVPGKACTRKGGFVDGVEEFDAAFFNISSREAEGMDPQQRLLLECAWHCFEDAGILPSTQKGKACGVFVGVTATDYGMLQAGGEISEEVNPYFNTGTPQNVCAGRISYVFGLEGPSMAVDTACSSSLTAIHLACQSLRSGDCDMALAGGVNLTLSPLLYSTLSAAGMLSVDGFCKPFDQLANGYARGEGCGLLALKRLSDAERDQDLVLGCLLGSCLNQDGASSGLTVPNGIAQKSLIEEALRRSNVRPEEIDYVEAHGTGTPLGDPIEVRALNRALACNRNVHDPLLVGSIKSNLGHLESAAGVFSVIKVLMALQRETVPPTLHVQELNQEIDWSAANIRPVTTAEPWPKRSDKRRLAGVSGFGASGSNAHLIIQEAPTRSTAGADRSASIDPILALSAANDVSLRRLAQQYLELLKTSEIDQFKQAACASLTQRDNLSHRCAIVIQDKEDAAEELGRLAEGAPLISGHGPAKAQSGRSVAFVFSGQGDVFPGMGTALYKQYQPFRAAIDECAELLGDSLGRDLFSILSDTQSTLTHRADWAQPALFSYQYALTCLWRSIGIQPAAVVGHSIGEFAAAVAAGASTLETALHAVVSRSSLMTELPQAGGMLAALAPREDLEPLLAGFENSSVSIAVENGPSNFVLAGAKADLENLAQALGEASIRSQPLAVTHAFHSCLMDPLLDEFEQAVAARGAPQPSFIPYFSSLCGGKLDHGTLLDARYWRRHCREPVRFAPAINDMLNAGFDCFIEVGPARTMTGLLRQLSPEGVSMASIASADAEKFEYAMANAWCSGLSVDWRAVPDYLSGDRRPLPLYPFDRRPYWIQSRTGRATENDEMTANKMTTQETTAEKTESVLSTLLEIFSSLLRLAPDAIDPDAHLIEMGADSLILVSGVNSIENEFGLKLEIQQLFEEITTLREIAGYIAQHAKKATAQSHEPATAAPLVNELPSGTRESDFALSDLPASSLNGPATLGNIDLERLITAQTQLMARHLELLRGSNPSAQATPIGIQSPLVTNRSEATKPSTSTDEDRSSPLRALNQPLKTPSTLTSQQQTHLDELVERHLERTPESKRLAQACRPQLADSRASVGFRFSTKEMLYPITGARSTGSRMIDVDGNEYVDLTMGFGVLLFGSRPAHMTGVVEQELSNGFQLGPRSPVMQEVASLFCELTGKERVAFTNSGTEAVMTAIRLARAATRRDKIVIFEGAYNGHSDGTLAKRVKGQDGQWHSEPVSPGIPGSVANDCLVLEYGAPESLETIRQHSGDIAAVLVEPVQSRNLELQPVEFLRDLRRLTEELDIALVFDEMITGFRVHPAGIQGLWGIEADLATYGKIIGGGTAIGAVAGSARFMDGVDGGMWQYGDESYPSAQRTYFGGTFCQHPVSMAGCLATLRELKRQGPTLQQALSERMREFADRVNRLFEKESLQLRIVFFGSIFTFRGPGNLEVFFYHLLEKGVYIWEWRACFLSTAHTDEDLDQVYLAIQDTIAAMRSGGFFPGKILPAETAREEPQSVTVEERVKFSLYFFGNYDAEYAEGKYGLLIDACRHGDQQGYEAIWIPERHFDRFGGFSPNPSVLAAALARETKSIKLRAGSIVLPLHHPLRVAEEWSLVDNLSDGRIGIGFATGWHPNDFALAPDNFENNRSVTFNNIDVIRRLWSGESESFTGGNGKKVDLAIFPRPKQESLPGWLTVVRNPDTYRKAAELGLGVLTNMLGQSLEELEENLRLYQQAWIEFGRHPADIRIAVLLHTYLEEDAGDAVEAARTPMSDYLLGSMALFQKMGDSLPEHLRNIDTVSEKDKAFIIAKAYERYVQERSLIGSPESCTPMVERLIQMGVTEIGCFLDFGISDAQVIEGLPRIDRLKKVFQKPVGLKVPTSDAQRQLWILSTLDKGGNAAYMDPAVIDWSGPIDEALLGQAFHHLIQRHESLRSNVVNQGQTLLIHPHPTATLEVQTFEGADDPETAAMNWLKDQLSGGVNLSNGNLFRPILLKLSSDHCLIALLAHHIVSDGPSMGILIRELTECYESMSQGQSTPVLQPTQAFSDYVQAQNTQRHSRTMQKSAAYWHSSLAPLPAPLDLPLDHPRQGVRTWSGQRTVLQSGERLAQKLESAAKQAGVTPYMLLHSAFAALLHRWSDHQDLIIGTASSGRTETQKPMVGYGVHLLPVRSQIEESATQLEFIDKTRKTLLDAYAHQAYPFAWLFDDLELQRDPARPPLVNVIFNYERLPAEYRFGNAVIRPVLAPATHARVDLTLTVNHIGSELELVADYNSDLFEDQTIRRLLRSFDQFIDLFSHPADRLISELPLLSTADYDETVRRWNNAPAPDSFAPLPEILRNVTEARPDSVAVRVLGQPDSDLSFADLTKKTAAFAHRLLSKGIEPHQRIGILLEPTPDQIVALLACLEIGCPYVPMDPGYPRDHLQYLIDDAQIALLITDRDTNASTQLRVPDLCEIHDVGAGNQGSTDRLPHSIAGPDIAYVIYTSGSTGKPKGVEVTHQGLSNYVLWASRAYQADYGDGAPILCSLGFDAAVTSVFAPLTAGKPTVLIPAENETQALQHLAGSTNRFSFFKMTPAHLEILNRFRDLGSDMNHELTKFLVLGGEALASDHVNPWFGKTEAAITAVNEYGPTEATVGCCAFSLAESSFGNVPIGQPIQGVQLFVLDNNLVPVLPGAPGELYIGGIGLARGYLNQPCATAEKFIPNPFGSEFKQAGSRLYRTGDLVRLSSQGQLEFLGRTDSQVKINGFRVEPGEIEATLLQHPDVRQAAVVKRSLGEKSEGLAAFIQPVTDGAVQVSDLRNWLEDRLPSHLIPSYFSIRETLPLSTHGKLDRKALTDIALPQSTVVPIDQVSPKNEVEKQIHGIWQQVLGRNPISGSDNFFDLGGTSLQIIEVHTQLAHLLPSGAEVIDLFRHPTISSLARFISGDTDSQTLRPNKTRLRAQKQLAARRRHRG